MLVMLVMHAKSPSSVIAPECLEGIQDSVGNLNTNSDEPSSWQAHHIICNPMICIRICLFMLIRNATMIFACDHFSCPSEQLAYLMLLAET